MRADHWLGAAAQEGIVVIESAGDFHFSLLGATCPTSVEPDFFQELHTLTVSPKPGKDALLAILIHTSGHGSAIMDHGFFIPIRWQGNKAFADLKSLFISPAKRIGQVMGRSGMSRGERAVKVLSDDGQWFIASRLRDGLSPVGEPPPNHRRLENANLLCEFLLGNASDEDLRLVASGDMRTALERELAQAQKELAQTSALLLEAKEREEKAVADAKAEREELYQEVSNALFNEGPLRTRFGWLPWRKIYKVRLVCTRSKMKHDPALFMAGLLEATRPL